MARRPTYYAALCPLRLNVSERQDEFLWVMAKQLGIGKAEFLRRILADAIPSWTREGLYVAPAQNGERVGSRMLVAARRRKGLHGPLLSRERHQQHQGVIMAISTRYS